MSRDKSVWFAEEILIDAKLIDFQLETGEWDAVEEMLRSEAQLSRDPETGRLRPKKASEYTLRHIGNILHIMRMDIEQQLYNVSTLAVAEQCLRLIRSCAASGMKIQTYVSKDLSILADMLSICDEYQSPSGQFVSEAIARKYDVCMVVLVQTLGNLVVNNPFNQIIVWDKFERTILHCLICQNEKIASGAAMIVYNVLLGQPNVLPDDVHLLNSLAYMYSTGNSEFPHLIIEYLVGVENSYIEKLYNRLEPDTKLLILNLAYNILMFNETQDINVSVNFIKFIAHEFKMKSDCILKTVDKYVNSIEPQEVVFLLDIIATASSMDAYIDYLQNDVSLFINCAYLLQIIHKIGKESNNFFSSINKLYDAVGKTVPEKIQEIQTAEKELGPSSSLESLKKNDSTDNMLQCNETMSCTESESSEQYYECQEQFPYLEKIERQNVTETLQPPLKFVESVAPEAPGAPEEPHVSDNVVIDDRLDRVSFVKARDPGDADREVERGTPTGESGAEQKLFSDDEPPLIIDDHPAGEDHDLKSSCDASDAPNANDAESAESIVAAEPQTELQPQDDQTILSASSDTENEHKIAEVSAEVHTVTAKPVSSPVETNVKEVKRSQNMSTDFDLSEQLQKILGISADKALKAEISDPNKETAKPSPVIKEVKIVEAPIQIKLPNVKIDSPDGPHKHRLGSVDQTKPKKVATSVESVEQHVAFGFKAMLIRTLGNLCWKNQINKRQIRELDVIPVLLDCCNIDARNPLITQWVIFAVRNLCENCPENQTVISSLTLQKPVNNEVLEEMGLTLNVDSQNNSIRLVPLAKK